MSAPLKHFRAVAEKSHGIKRGYSERPVNPFHIRDIFDPNLKITVERRTWADIPATSERAARALFAEAVAKVPDMAGFKLTSLVEIVIA